MSGLRAIVSVNATKSGSGSSGVARYIAKSKWDEEREGRGPRPIFNGKAREKLTRHRGAAGRSFENRNAGQTAR
jgi:hypothetical protein